MVWSLVLFANEETLCHSFVDDRKMIAAVAVYRPSVSTPRAPVPRSRVRKAGIAACAGGSVRVGVWVLPPGSEHGSRKVLCLLSCWLQEHPWNTWGKGHCFLCLLKCSGRLKPWKILFQLSTLVTKWRNMFISYIGQFFTHTVHSSPRNTGVHFKLSFF